jgi:hypothetical protein
MRPARVNATGWLAGRISAAHPFGGARQTVRGDRSSGEGRCPGREFHRDLVGERFAQSGTHGLFDSRSAVVIRCKT